MAGQIVHGEYRRTGVERDQIGRITAGVNAHKRHVDVLGNGGFDPAAQVSVTGNTNANRRAHVFSIQSLGHFSLAAAFITHHGTVWRRGGARRNRQSDTRAGHAVVLVKRKYDGGTRHRGHLACR